MKLPTIIAVLILAAAQTVFATTSGTLVVENRSSGRTYSITVKADGTFESPAVPSGSYRLIWSPRSNIARTKAGTIKNCPAGATVKYEVASSASRSGSQHHYINLRATPSRQDVSVSDIATDSFTVDADNSVIAGSITMTDSNGKVMAVDDWQDPTVGSQNR